MCECFACEGPCIIGGSIGCEDRDHGRSYGLHHYTDGACGCLAGNSVGVGAVTDGQPRDVAGDVCIICLDCELSDGQRVGERRCGRECTTFCQVAVERGEVKVAGE